MQFPARSVRGLDVQTGSSRSSHIGVAALIGGAGGAAAGALLGQRGEYTGTGTDAALLGVLGLILGSGVGAVLPVHYTWLRVVSAP